jgi:hypothetical protein
MNWETLIILSIGWGMICYALAIRKNRRPIRWAITGFLFGLFAIIMLAIMPKVGKKE